MAAGDAVVTTEGGNQFEQPFSGSGRVVGASDTIGGITAERPVGPGDNLATIIETCRKRSVSPWPYLAEVIRQRRKGCPAPALPALVGLAVSSA
jgi:hypothetical protein